MKTLLEYRIKTDPIPYEGDRYRGKMTAWTVVGGSIVTGPDARSRYNVDTAVERVDLRGEGGVTRSLSRQEWLDFRASATRVY